MTLTKEQINIIDIASKMQKNEILIVQAFAGAGKTSTLVELTKHINDKKFLYLAFNKAIVSESKKRFGKNVEIFTTHSLAYQMIVGNKEVSLRDDYKPVEISERYAISLEDAIETLKALKDFFANSDKIITSHNIVAKEVANRIYNQMRNFMIPITHSFYLKEFQLIGNKKIENEFDYVLLDEAQDTNSVTLDIFLKFNAAKILVGDTHQAIYSFRSTTAIDAMSCVKYNYKLNLTTTFRCCKEIVRDANIVLSIFKGEKVRIVSMTQGAPKNDSFAVICRTNSSIISTIAKAIEHNEKCPDDEVKYRILRSPDSIFKTAINLYYFIENKYEHIHTQFKYLTKFKSIKVLEQYISDSNDIELQSSYALANRYRGFLFILLDKAKEFYKSRTGDILITAHTSKGLEFDEVMLLNDFPRLSELRMLNDPTFIEETNLYYVAITRAKWFLTDKTKNREFIKNLF